MLTLVLNGVAFWFTYALYGKRELLKDRNDRFESFTIEIAKTLEGAQPEQTEDDKAALAEMPVIDMESTDAEHAGKALTDLEVRSFWTEGEGGYHIEYESTPEFYQGPDPQDLKEVYVLDAEKKAKLNARGEAVKEGSKMDVALNEIVAKSEAQRDYYTKVRGQLTALREEYEALVPQIHTLKEESRQRAQTIIDRDNTISGLEADKANLEGQVADRDQQIASLEEEKSVLQGDLDAVTEERDTLADEVENLKKTMPTPTTSPPSPTLPPASRAPSSAPTTSTTPPSSSSPPRPSPSSSAKPAIVLSPRSTSTSAAPARLMPSLARSRSAPSSRIRAPSSATSPPIGSKSPSRRATKSSTSTKIAFLPPQLHAAAHRAAVFLPPRHPPSSEKHPKPGWLSPTPKPSRANPIRVRPRPL